MGACEGVTVALLSKNRGTRMNAKFVKSIVLGFVVALSMVASATELESPVNVNEHRAIFFTFGSDGTFFTWGERGSPNFLKEGLNIGGDRYPPSKGLLVEGRTGIGTENPKSALHVSGPGATAEVTIAPDGENEASQLRMCQDRGCGGRTVLRYDGGRNSFFLYFNNGLDNDRTALKIEHHANSAARVGINVPADHDIKNELEVNGTIRAEEIEVIAAVADYVFDDNFPVMGLDEVAKFIDRHRHLPGMPSKSEVIQRGGTVPLGETFTTILQKVEELTIYAIEQQKTLNDQQMRLAAQQREMREMKAEIESLRRGGSTMEN